MLDPRPTIKPRPDGPRPYSDEEASIIQAAMTPDIVEDCAERLILGGFPPPDDVAPDVHVNHALNGNFGNRARIIAAYVVSCALGAACFDPKTADEAKVALTALLSAIGINCASRIPQRLNNGHVPSRFMALERS